MTFKELIKKLHLNTPIEIYYNDCEFVNEGTTKEITKMYAYSWFLFNKEVESITINEQSKALMVTLIK